MFFKGKEKIVDVRRKELVKDIKSDYLIVVNVFEVKNNLFWVVNCDSLFKWKVDNRIGAYLIV